MYLVFCFYKEDNNYRSAYMSVFSHVLLVFNSSTNIIIYSWKDKKFRNILKRKLNIFNLPMTNTTSYMETVQRQGTLGSTRRKRTEETVVRGEGGSDSLMSSGASDNRGARAQKSEV